MLTKLSGLLAVTIIGIASPAAARPWLYISTFTYSGKAEVCLNQARTALASEGFTKDLEIDWQKDKANGGTVEGILTNSPIRAKIECNPKDGVTGLAVTGLDNDLTYSKYGKLFDATW